MNKTVQTNGVNPFEYLRIPPGADDREILDQARLMVQDISSEKERIQIRAAVERITINPKGRLAHEVTTHQGADYSTDYWTNARKAFIGNLLDFLRGTENPSDVTFEHLNDFSECVYRDPDCENLEAALNAKDTRRAGELWRQICKRNDSDKFFAHSIALLHQNWALDCEKQGDFRHATRHWHESLKQWFKLLSSSDFWNHFRTGNPRLSADELREFINGFPQQLLGVHETTAKDYLKQRQFDGAALHLGCLRLAAKSRHRSVKSQAEQLLDKITSEWLEEAKTLLNADDKGEGIREDYESAINHIADFLEADKDNSRALRFVVDKFNEWLYDLYTSEETDELRKLIKRSVPFADRFAKLVPKGQGYRLESKVVARNLLVRGFATKSYRRAAEFYREALEYDPDFENAKELLRQAEEQSQYEIPADIEKILKKGNVDAAVRKANVAVRKADRQSGAALIKAIATVFNNEGLHIAETGNVDSAIECLENALSLCPEEDSLRRNLAGLYNQRGTEAVNALFGGDLPNLRRLSGHTDFLTEVLQNAVYDLLEAVKLDPENEPAKRNLKTIRNLPSLPGLNWNRRERGRVYPQAPISKSKSKTTRPKRSPSPPQSDSRLKEFFRSLVQKWWFWFIVIFISLVAIGRSGL